MTKRAQSVETPETVAKIQPVITPNAQVSSSFNAKPGHYHLIKLDANGKEMFGTDVNVAPNTFRRTFEKLTKGDNPTYLVKKNPNK